MQINYTALILFLFSTTSFASQKVQRRKYTQRRPANIAIPNSIVINPIVTAPESPVTSPCVHDDQNSTVPLLSEREELVKGMASQIVQLRSGTIAHTLSVGECMYHATVGCCLGALMGIALTAGALTVGNSSSTYTAQPYDGPLFLASACGGGVAGAKGAIHYAQSKRDTQYRHSIVRNAVHQWRVEEIIKNGLEKYKQE